MEPIRITADIMRNVNIPIPVITQHDTGREIIITIRQDGMDKPLDEGIEYTITSRRADGESYFSFPGIKTGDNDITFRLGSPELSKVGNVDASIQMYIDGLRISTLKFTYRVVEDLTVDYIPTENEQTLIEMVLYEGPDIIQEAREVSIFAKEKSLEVEQIIDDVERRLNDGDFVGPQGPQGEIGPEGLKGDTGDIGPHGEVGPRGPQGLKGDTGDTGPQGLIGDTGPQGEIGPEGPQGEIGPEGPQGLKGDTGPEGPQGLKGDTGDTGPKGDRGPEGPEGPQGLKGDTGDVGPKGDTGTGVRILGRLDDVSELPEVGNSGDSYMINSNLYVWVETEWVDSGGIKGEKGDRGEEGLKGDTGEQGPQGDPGPKGEDGDVGPRGEQGLKGDPFLYSDFTPEQLEGLKGPQGDVGPKGEDGVGSITSVNNIEPDSSGNVSISIPSTTSQLTNDSNYATQEYVDNKEVDVSGLATKQEVDAYFEKIANKVTLLTKGRLYTDFSDFIAWFGDVTHTSEHIKTGDMSLRIATDEGNPSSAARMQNARLYFSSVKNLMLRLYIDNHDLLSYVRIRFHVNNNNYAQWEEGRWDFVAGWNEIPISIDDLTITGDWSLDDKIDYIQINVVGNNSGNEHTSVTFDAIYLNRTERPRAILHFDDGWLSQFTKAFPIMRAMGFVGCIGVYSEAVGLSSYMNEEQLKTLHNYGWELFNHTVTHRDLTTLSREEIEQEVMGCKDWLDSRGYTQSSDIIAYPFGAYDDNVLDAVKDFRIGRTVTDGHETSTINQHRMKVINILSDTTVEEVIEAVDKAIATSSTVIFLFHKIEDSGVDEMIWNTDRFNQLVNYLDEKRDGIDVITTDEWLRFI